MSREDIQESLVPTGPVWHTWNRVGPTRDHLDSAGMNWPTAPATCEWCREYRPYVAVSLLEGTFGTTPEHWPGRCPVNDPESAKPLTERSRVVMTGSSPSPVGRGLIRAFGMALVLGYLSGALVHIFANWPLWAWIPLHTGLGLGAGLMEMTKPSKTTRSKKG